MLQYAPTYRINCSLVLVIDALPKSVDLLLKNVVRELEHCQKNEILLTLQVLQCYKVDNDFFAPLFAVRTRVATVSSDELDEYKTSLLICLQYKKNLKYVTERFLTKSMGEGGGTLGFAVIA